MKYLLKRASFHSLVSILIFLIVSIVFILKQSSLNDLGNTFADSSNSKSSFFYAQDTEITKESSFAFDAFTSMLMVLDTNDDRVDDDDGILDTVNNISYHKITLHHQLLTVYTINDLRKLTT